MLLFDAYCGHACYRAWIERRYEVQLQRERLSAARLAEQAEQKRVASEKAQAERLAIEEQRRLRRESSKKRICKWCRCEFSSATPRVYCKLPCQFAANDARADAKAVHVPPELIAERAAMIRAARLEEVAAQHAIHEFTPAIREYVTRGAHGRLAIVPIG